MTRHTAAAFAFVMMSLGAATITRAQGNAQFTAPRPIDAVDSLWTEELTWMEVRDAVKAGKTTVLIGTGGVEQNGPYVAGGKHNDVLQTVLPSIAKAIGNTLIAPVVKFVPEGAIEPEPRGHMQYEAQIAVQDPKLIRAGERIKAKLFTLHGVDQAPVSKTVEIGKKLAEYRAGITARAFKASVQKLRPAP